MNSRCADSKPQHPWGGHTVVWASVSLHAWEQMGSGPQKVVPFLCAPGPQPPSFLEAAREEKVRLGRWIPGLEFSLGPGNGDKCLASYVLLYKTQRKSCPRDNRTVVTGNGFCESVEETTSVLCFMNFWETGILKMTKNYSYFSPWESDSFIIQFYFLKSYFIKKAWVTKSPSSILKPTEGILLRSSSNWTRFEMGNN